MAWIRSQERNYLLDAAYIAVGATPEGAALEGAVIGDEGVMRIGKYDTIERAQSELDQIERWIADGAQGVFQVMP